MALTVDIAGTPAAVALGSLSMTLAVSGQRTLEFRCWDLTPPAVGSVLGVYDGVFQIFGGTIDEVESTLVREEGGRVAYRVRAVDYTQFAHRRVIGEYAWSNAKANDIARDIVTNGMAGDGISLSLVTANTGPVIEQFATNYVMVSDALDELCALIDYEWWIDEAKRLRFILRGTGATTHTVTAANVLQVGLSYRHTREASANHVVMIVEQAVNDFVQEFTATGVTPDWDVDNPIHLAPSIYVDGVAQTVGIYDVDTGKDVYWTQGSPTIRFDAGSLPANGTTIRVEYTALIRNVVAASNGADISARAALESSSGYYSRVVEYRDVSSRASAQDLAAAVLAGSLGNTKVFRFTSDTVDALPGDTVNFNIAGLGSSTTATVRASRWYDRGDGVLRYDTEAVEGPKLAGAADVFKQLAARSKGAAANAAWNFGGQITISHP